MNTVRNRWLGGLRALLGFSLFIAIFTGSAWASGFGVLVNLNPAEVAGFDARHSVESARLNANRDLYLVTTTDSRTDQQLLQEIETDPAAGNPELNHPVALQQSTASVLNGQSTASVLNGGSAAGQPTSVNLHVGGLLGNVLNPVVQPVVNTLGAVLNPLLGSVLNLNIAVGGNGSSVTANPGVLLSPPTYFYGAVVPSYYPSQPLVSQIDAGAGAYAKSTGNGAEVALIDNGVDPFNPVLSGVLDGSHGYNFYDNSPDWSAYADLGDGPTGGSRLDQSTASVLNGQSTASVLNGASCAQTFGSTDGSQLNQSTASVLNGQSTASVLNGQSTASVLNGQSTASVLNGLNQILACDPDFGHGTSVAGLIHLIAPRAKILPIKAFGPGGTADSATIYEAITYAIDQHVDVMNLSFSATEATGYVAQAIEEAVNDGIVVVAAAGNDGSSAAVFPASLPGVIGTGAVDGTVSGYPAAPYSNFDAAPGQFVDVDVAAPGTQLFTTFPGGGQIWATSSGTSFSTPLVAGEAALLVQLHSSGAAARALIEANANPSIAGDNRGQMGHGMVDVLSALRSASPSLLSWLWW